MKEIACIDAHIFEAKKNGDKIVNDTLTFLKAELQNKRIEVRRPLRDDEMIAVAKKVVKELKEITDVADKAGRTGFADIYREQIAIIEEYIPAEMTAEEVERAVRDIVHPGMNMGVAMKAVMVVLRGKADGKVISSIVKKVIDE